MQHPCPRRDLRWLVPPVPPRGRRQVRAATYSTLSAPRGHHVIPLLPLAVLFASGRLFNGEACQRKNIYIRFAAHVS